MLAIPNRLEHRVCKPRVEQILHRLLAEEMVDPEDVLVAVSIRA
jgi:hypothetical protein